MRIHIPSLEVRDQKRMPQGPHIVQPNHHPRFHGALPVLSEYAVTDLILRAKLAFQLFSTLQPPASAIQHAQACAFACQHGGCAAFSVCFGPCRPSLVSISGFAVADDSHKSTCSPGILSSAQQSLTTLHIAEMLTSRLAAC